jgi:GGDEF domain-containing protein
MASEEVYKAQIERLKRRVAELEQQVDTDELTSIMNRRGLMQMLTAFTPRGRFSTEKSRSQAVSNYQIVQRCLCGC